MGLKRRWRIAEGPVAQKDPPSGRSCSPSRAWHSRQALPLDSTSPGRRFPLYRGPLDPLSLASAGLVPLASAGLVPCDPVSPASAGLLYLLAVASKSFLNQGY